MEPSGVMCRPPTISRSPLPLCMKSDRMVGGVRWLGDDLYFNVAFNEELHGA